MSAKPHSVLVVDDDVDIRQSVVEILREEGFEAHGAANGVEALDFLRAREHPAVILLDLMMPRMNGWQLREALEHDPDLAGIPVIVLSAHPGGDQLHAAAFLPKPFNFERLLGTVEQYARPAA